MSKILFVLFLTTGLFLNSGCLLLEGAASDISGWDISACVSGFSTCWELFIDNADKFEDGFLAAIDSLGPQTGAK